MLFRHHIKYTNNQFLLLLFRHNGKNSYINWRIHANKIMDGVFHELSKICNEACLNIVGENKSKPNICESQIVN